MNEKEKIFTNSTDRIYPGSNLCARVGTRGWLTRFRWPAPTRTRGTRSSPRRCAPPATTTGCCTSLACSRPPSVTLRSPHDVFPDRRVPRSASRTREHSPPFQLRVLSMQNIFPVKNNLSIRPINRVIYFPYGWLQLRSRARNLSSDIIQPAEVTRARVRADSAGAYLVVVWLKGANSMSNTIEFHY